LGFLDAEVSVTFVDDAAIADLAGRFGRVAEPTDVLAFSMLEGDGAEFRGSSLGDVVISVETGERQARERGVSIDREVRDLVIHGVLHLVGMDHVKPSDARSMRELEDHLRWEILRLE
jgi:probable rRNA maturation factor